MVAFWPVESMAMDLVPNVNGRTSPTFIVLEFPLLVTTIVKFCLATTEDNVELAAPKCLTIPPLNTVAVKSNVVTPAATDTPLQRISEVYCVLVKLAT